MLSAAAFPSRGISDQNLKHVRVDEVFGEGTQWRSSVCRVGGGGPHSVQLNTHWRLWHSINMKYSDSYKADIFEHHLTDSASVQDLLRTVACQQCAGVLAEAA